MEDVVILSALRTPLGKRGRGLAEVHPARLLGQVQSACLDTVGLDPDRVEHVVGGCVGQVGEQSFNITRTAWLSEGLPASVAASTVDAQCGSSQQALTNAFALIKSGTASVALACGVESLSRIPIGSNYRKDFGLGRPVPPEYLERYEFLSQYQAAEWIGEKWNITREQADGLGVRSQTLAARAWADGCYDSQILPFEAKNAEGGVRTISVDECLRETTLDGLAELSTVVPGGIHTAGTASPISDGASAVLLATRSIADELEVRPLARVVDSISVGVDPVSMLLGPHSAVPRLLDRNGLTIDDIDLVEINEAFASVVLSWIAESGVDPEKVNPNGGAIAMGHPLGATGCVLVTKAAHELSRTKGRYAIVTMCCGGGIGTATLLEHTN